MKVTDFSNRLRLSMYENREQLKKAYTFFDFYQKVALQNKFSENISKYVWQFFLKQLCCFP